MVTQNLEANGNSKTEELRMKYSYENVIIEDFVDFSYILPHTDVFVTNGGYGSTLLSLMNNVPIVVAGIHEGKNEICARIGYFQTGINLKTDRPKAGHIKKSVEEILHTLQYVQNIAALQQEFKEYNPLAICENHAYYTST